MKKEDFFEVLEDVDGEMLTDAVFSQRRKRNVKWLVLGITACLVLVFGTIYANFRGSSSGVTVRNISSTAFIPLSKGELIYLTEEEIFTHWELAIFKGTVKNIQNIEIDFSGEKEYRALAEIEVTEIYHGEIAAGEKVTVLLPCSISPNIWVEDTDVIANLEIGMSGIFMPMVYDKEAYWEQNEATLMLRELAEFGFADGRRYAFLETDRGIIYAKEAFPNLPEAYTLGDVKVYILDIIQKHMN